MSAFGTYFVVIILIYAFLSIFVIVVVSLIFRPYILWYFKINKRLKQQEETNRLLKELSSTSKYIPTYNTPKERDYSSYMPK